MTDPGSLQRCLERLSIAAAQATKRLVDRADGLLLDDAWPETSYYVEARSETVRRAIDYLENSSKLKRSATTVGSCPEAKNVDYFRMTRHSL